MADKRSCSTAKRLSPDHFAAGLATLPPFGFSRHDCPTNAVGDQPGTKREQGSACPEGTHDLGVFSEVAGDTAAHPSKLLVIAT